MTHALIVFTLSSSFPIFQQTASMIEGFPLTLVPQSSPFNREYKKSLEGESPLLIPK